MGPLHRTRRWREIKLDFAFDEVLVNLPAQRPLLPTYSDEPLPAVSVTAYALEELCAEKRTLLQGTQPRDLYDVWRLLNEQADQLDMTLVAETFQIKCRHRSLSPGDLTQILAPDQVQKMRRAWEARLSDQLAEIPSLERVVREVQRALRQFPALKE